MAGIALPRIQPRGRGCGPAAAWSGQLRGGNHFLVLLRYFLFIILSFPSVLWCFYLFSHHPTRPPIASRPTFSLALLDGWQALVSLTCSFPVWPCRSLRSAPQTPRTSAPPPYPLLRSVRVVASRMCFSRIPRTLLSGLMAPHRGNYVF